MRKCILVLLAGAIVLLMFSPPMRAENPRIKNEQAVTSEELREHPWGDTEFTSRTATCFISEQTICNNIGQCSNSVIDSFLKLASNLSIIRCCGIIFLNQCGNRNENTCQRIITGQH